MGWRFLVDEDTDTDAAVALTDRGHDAVTVEAAIGKGKPDARVARCARETDRVLITTDRDFLDAELNAELRVLLVSADDADGDEVAKKADELANLAETPDDLKRVTWL
jgi:predicted nuclease of predicted toxin-antitoxin system